MGDWDGIQRRARTFDEHPFLSTGYAPRQCGDSLRSAERDLRKQIPPEAGKKRRKKRYARRKTKTTRRMCPIRPMALPKRGQGVSKPMAGISHRCTFVRKNTREESGERRRMNEKTEAQNCKLTSLPPHPWRPLRRSRSRRKGRNLLSGPPLRHRGPERVDCPCS